MPKRKKHKSHQPSSNQLLNAIVPLSAITLRGNTLGENYLHVIARSSQPLIQYQQFYQCVDFSVLIQLAQTVNNRGFLPADELKQNTKISAAEKTAVQNQLYSLCGLTTADIHQLLVTDSVMKAWNAAPTTRNFNLAVGTYIVNLVRQTIQRSSTDLKNNCSLSENEVTETLIQVRKMRAHYVDAINLVSKSKLLTCHYTAAQLDLALIAYLTMLYRVGNCAEFAVLGLILMQKYNSATIAEIFKISNGDHDFLVIGRAPQSNPRDFHTWGNDAVVCDAWKGDVYSAAQIPTHLNDYRRVSLNDNTFELSILTNFNRNYHVIDLRSALNHLNCPCCDRSNVDADAVAKQARLEKELADLLGYFNQLSPLAGSEVQPISQPPSPQLVEESNVRAAVQSSPFANGLTLFQLPVIHAQARLPTSKRRMTI